MKGTPKPPLVRVVAGATLLALLLFAVGAWAAPEKDADGNYGAAEARKVSQMPERWITTDHSKHEILQGNFTSGPEVTKACLSCHNQASLQIHETIHWTWLCPHDPNKDMGKYAKTLNNFCISVPSNEPRCTSCHAGYGWKDKNFDLTSQENVDCLVCHDQTGTYKKFPAGAGNPVSEEKVFPGNGKTYYPPDWNKVAQSVGRPSRKNCGTCHFTGGGGDGVKHGDLDTSLMKPSKELDVHMAADGANFDCVRCHTTKGHKIAGRCYKHPASEDPNKSLIQDDQITRITCVSCHTDQPHGPGMKANDHTDKVACQSCHIPEFARELPTKMNWDWSTAGKKKDGKPYQEEGPLGKHSYDTKKGDFIWKKNVQPEYFWFNGTLDYVLITDTIDPSGVVELNKVVGMRGDPNSRIYPFKVHRGKTPYDKNRNTMVIPHLFPRGKDDTDAYWKGYDWNKAAAAGMEYAGYEFGGEVGFVETSYHFQTTHMVAPAEKSVQCAECHSREGRLATLGGFYMPGRDRVGLLDTIGWAVAALSLGGVLLHWLLRLATRKRRA